MRNGLSRASLVTAHGSAAQACRRLQDAGETRGIAATSQDQDFVHYSSCSGSRYGVQASPAIAEGRTMTTNDTAQVTTPEAPSSELPASPKWCAALGLVAGVGAIVASSSCVIPL